MKQFILSSCCMAVAAISAEYDLNDFFLGKLVEAVPSIMRSYHPETGRFGTEPWICNDQHSMFHLAVAWATESPDNPYYHDPKLLEAIVKAGDALIDDMDEKGMWLFRKKDNSTWGMIHMPWTYSRWIRSYMLIRNAMTNEQRERWDKAFKLAFGYIQNYCKTDNILNIPAHHAMALYAAGIVFENDEWKKTASEYMAKVVAAQAPEGFWTEHYGPVVNYNSVYIDAIGAYYSMSKDATVLPALEKAVRFHSMILWKDGKSASALDERNGFSNYVNYGGCGFTWTENGRGFLLKQLEIIRENDLKFYPDYLASMVLQSGKGKAIMPTDLAKGNSIISNDKKMCMYTSDDWQFFFSAYTCEPPKTNRWIMDRHNMLDVYKDGLGLIIGGGNTRMQPLLSTFTFGDISQLPMDNSENPVLVPDIPLKWYPSNANIIQKKSIITLSLEYGENKAEVSACKASKGARRLRYSLKKQVTGECQAHVPLYKRGTEITLANGKSVPLDAPFTMSADEIGGSFVYDGICYKIPANATIIWPVKMFSPYTKDGTSTPDTDKLVISFTLDRKHRHGDVFISEQH